MIAVANRFSVAEGYEEEFVERFSGSEGEVASQPGFVKFELLTPANEDTDTFVAMTYWESEADFRAWTETEDFHAAHADSPPEGMFEGHPDLEIGRASCRERVLRLV